MGRRREPFDHGNYQSPWRERQPGPEGELGPEYLPISPRSGRAVAQSSAERDWAEGFHSMPTQGHDAGGLWDHDEERKLRGRAKVPLTLPRYDEAEMRAFVERPSSKVTTHEWLVYTLFWLQRRSYSSIALELGRNRDKVYAVIKNLRIKLHNARGATRSGLRSPSQG